MRIHPTAVIDPKAQVADDVKIGPFCVVGPKVTIGSGTELANNVTVLGHTTIGCNNRISPYAVLGGEPQDLGYKGEETYLRIGDENVVREYVTMNCGTTKQKKTTIVGNRCLFMAYCHIAHDCHIGNNVVMANGVQIGGHVEVEDDVTFGGLVAVHHFVTIGRKAFIGGTTGVHQDCPPFMTTDGRPARVKGVNTVGLKRRGFSPAQIEALKEAYKLIYRSQYPRLTAVEMLERKPDATPEVRQLLQFLRGMEKGRQGRALEALRRTPVVPSAAAAPAAATQPAG